jgi:hypothetical protein
MFVATDVISFFATDYTDLHGKIQLIFLKKDY